jgi:hypothetical protein
MYIALPSFRSGLIQHIYPSTCRQWIYLCRNPTLNRPTLRSRMAIHPMRYENVGVDFHCGCETNVRYIAYPDPPLR